MKFLDQAKVYIRSGDGGAGAVSAGAVQVQFPSGMRSFSNSAGQMAEMAVGVAMFGPLRSMVSIH